jgi:hypothetical protein
MQGYAGNKYSQNVGEGHITIFPWSYSAIIAGTWILRAGQTGAWGYQQFDNNTGDNNDQVDFKVYLEIGTYTFTLVYWRYPDAGILDLLIDAASVGTIDMYGSSNAFTVSSITGIVVASRGIKTLSWKINGKNASSSDYMARYQLASLFRTA